MCFLGCMDAFFYVMHVRYFFQVLYGGEGGRCVRLGERRYTSGMCIENTLVFGVGSVSMLGKDDTQIFHQTRFEHVRKQERFFCFCVCFL